MSRASSITLTACPVCAGKRFARRPVPERTVGGTRWATCSPPLGLCRCRRCGFVFVNPRPTPATLDGFYRAADYTAHEPVDDAAARRRARLQLEALAGWGAQLRGAAVLDIGCGGGHLLASARGRGARVAGFDVAPHAVAACQRLDIDVTSDPKALALGTFDGVVMSHVFEHVSDLDATLDWCRALLRPDGWLCIEVPNVASLRAALSLPPLATQFGFDERYRAFPIHLSYFSPRTLRRLLKRHAFGTVRFTTVGFGLDGLRAAPPAPGSRPDLRVPKHAPGSRPDLRVPKTASRSALKAPTASARAMAKRMYFGGLLGENLISFARR